MSGEQQGADEAGDDDLRPETAGIEELPLEERAAAYDRIHDRLQSRLEGADRAADDG